MPKDQEVFALALRQLNFSSELDHRKVTVSSLVCFTIDGSEAHLKFAAFGSNFDWSQWPGTN